MRERGREQRGREREKEREWQSRPCSVIILPREERGRSLAAFAVSAVFLLLLYNSRYRS